MRALSTPNRRFASAAPLGSRSLASARAPAARGWALRSVCLLSGLALAACSSDVEDAPTGPPSVVPVEDVTDRDSEREDTASPDQDATPADTVAPPPADVEPVDATAEDTRDEDASPDPDATPDDPDIAGDAHDDDVADVVPDDSPREAAEPCDEAHPCVSDLLCVRLDPGHAMGFCTPACTTLHTSCGYFGPGLHSECALELGGGDKACGFVCVLDHGDHSHTYECPVTEHGRMRCERSRRDQGHRYCAPPQP